MQAELAARFSVHRVSVQNWERGATEPTIRYLPKIIEFLGYDPVPEPVGLPSRIAYARRRLGLTQEELADALCSDCVTLYRWENGLAKPSPQKIQILQKMLHNLFQLGDGALNATD